MTAPPALISMTGHALSGRRFDIAFHNWFVPEYQNTTMEGGNKISQKLL